jgi:hypothetical protein
VYFFIKVFFRLLDDFLDSDLLLPMSKRSSLSPDPSDEFLNSALKFEDLTRYTVQLKYLFLGFHDISVVFEIFTWLNTCLISHLMH